ncbi:jerky protein homolog-like isoform X1 [Scylla paramamosain]|uniref:jerky protein homolog-like isoform X1 n=1 Tax=Scylla paramamosain TaxID=85552 RepID=UPI00308328CC
MTAEIFLDWFKHCFVPSVKENLKKNGLPEDSKLVLLLDNCRAHPPAEELVVGNIFAVYLPPNVTSVIQPMDQGVIQNFKMNYRKSFLRKLVNYEDSTIPEFQKQLNVKDAIFMASLAWLDVKRQTLMRCWRKLYPLMMCDDEDDEEFEGFVGGMKNLVVSELREMGGNVELKVTDEALQEWVDVDENQAVTFTLTDEELINAVVEDHLEKISDDRDDDDDDDNEPKVTWEQAAKHIAGFVRFAEQCSYMSTRDVMTLYCIENEVLLQRRSCKQGDIRNYFKVPCKGKEMGQTSTESDDVDDPEGVQ